LGHPAFEKSDQPIAALGAFAESALRQQLKADQPLETRRRIEGQLKRIAETPQPPLTAEMLRQIRAVSVLARLPGVESRRLLEHLAGGVPGAALTRAAKTALGQ
jgi:hypothetical protein